MNQELKEYLKSLIVDHGIKNLDQLDNWEMSNIYQKVDFCVIDELFNDDKFFSLLADRNPYTQSDTYTLLDKIRGITTTILLSNIQEEFEELLAQHNKDYRNGK